MNSNMAPEAMVAALAAVKCEVVLGINVDPEHHPHDCPCNGTGLRYPGLTRPCPDCFGEGGGTNSHPEYEPTWECTPCNGTGTRPVEPMVGAMVMIADTAQNPRSYLIRPPYGNQRALWEAKRHYMRDGTIRLAIGKDETPEGAILAAKMQELGLEASDE